MATRNFGPIARNGTAPGQNGRCWAVAATAPVSGTLTSISVYVVTTSSGAKAKAILWSDSGSNLPASRLGLSSGFGLNGTAGYKTSPAMSVSVVSGVKYWLSIDGGGSGYPALGNDYPNSGFNLIRKDGMSYASPPSTFPTPDGNDANESLTIYGTITYSSGVTVTMTGNAASAGLGSFSLKSQRVVTGNAAHAYGGALAPRLAKVAAGLAAASASGVLMPRSAPVLAGEEAEAITGLFAPSLQALVSGVSSEGNEGSLSPAKAITLGGVYASGSEGSFATRAQVTISGNAASVSEGTLVPMVRGVLGGVSTSATVGTFAPRALAALVGLEATGFIGVLSPPGNVVVALDGIAANGIVGTLTPQIRIAASGVAASASVGAFAARVSAFLAGNVATASSGSFRIAVMPTLAGIEASGVVGSFRFTQPPLPQVICITIENIDFAETIVIEQNCTDLLVLEQDASPFTLESVGEVRPV